MIPVATPEEMAALDASSTVPVADLIERAGAAVARSALDLLGGAYGRRVVVIAGPGNNGNDGRAAARRLSARGIAVTTVAPGSSHPLPSCDLVIDAAFGTGFRGSWVPPEVPTLTPVLAVDIPSGVDGRTGYAQPGAVLRATRTVTFAGLKRGLLQGAGPDLAGEVVVADIGLDASTVAAALIEDHDVAEWLPHRERAAHKWQRAVWVVAGSPSMAGASRLAAAGALRAGAGFVRRSTPGAVTGDAGQPVEAVSVPLPENGWADVVLAGLDRVGAVVVGPGLGRALDTGVEVRRLVAQSPVPVVVDADGLYALGDDPAAFTQSTTVLTPHDGEYRRLAGASPGVDRFDAAADLADRCGATVLVKGATTVVAAAGARSSGFMPQILATTAGDARLATAGTGDVLAGMIAAFIARGMPPATAAVAAAHVHGRAGGLGWRDGLVAGDLPDLVPAVLDALSVRP